MMMKTLKKIIKAFVPYGLLCFLRKRAIGVSIPAQDVIAYLRNSITGWLDSNDVIALEYGIRHIKTQFPAIEIGSFCGLSTNIISFYMRKYNKDIPLFCSDKWTIDYASWADSGMKNLKPEITIKNYHDFLKESFINNCRMFSRTNLPYAIEEFSDDFFLLWEANQCVKDVFGRDIELGGNIGFAFIDGMHTYDFAKRDFYNVDKYMIKGGHIFMHDTFDGGPLEILVKEILKDGRYRVIMNNPNYLLRKEL
jgi:hypothetical protein